MAAKKKKENEPLINRFELKKESRKRFKEYKYKPLLTYLIPLAILSVTMAYFYQLIGYGAFKDAFVEAATAAWSQASHFFDMLHKIQFPAYPVPNVLAIIVAASLYIFRTLIAASYKGYCMKLSRRRSTSLKDLFCAFSFPEKAFGVELLRSLIVLIYALPAIAIFALGVYLFRFSAWWLVLCTIVAMAVAAPAVMVHYSYRQSLFILFDHTDWTAPQCLKESRRIMFGYRKELFALDLSCLGWQLLSSAVATFLFVSLVDIWVVPYLNITYAGFYDKMIDAEVEPLRPEYSL